MMIQMKMFVKTEKLRPRDVDDTNFKASKEVSANSKGQETGCEVSMWEERI